jgi:hypothetical protein
MTAPGQPGTAALASSRRFLWLLLVLGTVAYLGLFVFYPKLFPSVGVVYYGVWFLDSFAILASNDAWVRGFDVYAANPLDYFQRPHVYSSWWLELHKFGLSRADNLWVGLTLVTAFFAVALAGLRPSTPKELGWHLAVLCSSPMLLAVHRANNDLVIFLLLAPVVPCLISTRKPARFLAALLIVFAAGLKFYPAAAVFLLMARDVTGSRTRWAALGVAVGFLTVVGIGLKDDLARIGSMLPHVRAEGLMSFGAGNLFLSLGLSGGLAVIVAAAFVLLVAGIFFRARLLTDWTPAISERSAWLHFVLGASLLTACFFAGFNFAYRWIFGLWLVPFLWKICHDLTVSARVRRFGVTTAGLLLVALWADPAASLILTRLGGEVPGVVLVGWAERFFLIEQIFTWALFACLIGWLVQFIRTERFLQRVEAE